MANRRKTLTMGLGAVAALVAALTGGDVSLDELRELSTIGGIAPTNPGTMFGVHTRLTDEVEPWKIERTLDLVQALGAGWIVELFPWAYVEPRPGEYDWTHPDLVIREANRRGLTVIARLDLVPQWARPAQTTTRYLSRERYPNYARFSATFASRYRKAIRYFVIWNEPNTGFELGFQKVDAGDYVEMLAQSATAIRAVHPHAVIMTAGLAATVERSDLALNDLDFIRQMYDRGAAPYFDVLTAHAYGWKFPPSSPPGAERLNFRRVELYRQIMEERGDGAKPIIITESGWNDSPRWTKSVHPYQRIIDTIQALGIAQSWKWLQAMNVWVFRLPTLAHNYNDYFSLVDVNFRVKPIYDALKQRSGEWKTT